MRYINAGMPEILQIAL